MRKYLSYIPEMILANQFILEHQEDKRLLQFFSKKYLENSKSANRNAIEDFFIKNYPKASYPIITGIIYWIEEMKYETMA